MCYWLNLIDDIVTFMCTLGYFISFNPLHICNSYGTGGRYLSWIHMIYDDCKN